MPILSIAFIARFARSYEELTVTTFQAFCARLLRDEAAEAGLDPFATPVAPADPDLSP